MYSQNFSFSLHFKKFYISIVLVEKYLYCGNWLHGYKNVLLAIKKKRGNVVSNKAYYVNNKKGGVSAVHVPKTPHIHKVCKIHKLVVEVVVVVVIVDRDSSLHNKNINESTVLKENIYSCSSTFMGFTFMNDNSRVCHQWTNVMLGEYCNLPHHFCCQVSGHLMGLIIANYLLVCVCFHKINHENMEHVMKSGTKLWTVDQFVRTCKRRLCNTRRGDEVFALFSQTLSAFRGIILLLIIY